MQDMRSISVYNVKCPIDAEAAQSHRQSSTL